MNFDNLLEKNKSQIIDLWIRKFTDTYPDESARFFRDGAGQFANPVGHTFRVNLESIFDELFQESDPDRMGRLLDGIVRIRAVQGFRPSEAVCFVPMLRQAVWESCGREISRQGLMPGWVDFLNRLEWLMNMSFDIYMSCRELLWKQKAEFMNSRTHKLLERANLLDKAVE
ncbi:RsbRD N-terminal domain-containing protein [Desulfonatronovibrio hydrogenovorans]|uniref:RsbRD N-terminal domain-containing protein n=1 Tax=Desulfonatronovibrio hydrogenovorans TaxID=53245 RepID=UPI00048A877A|nr:RsbRD N-terminal domain-containing protein [Desulfonatronovibrio hydrogenovorans]